jgi:hypothetical protein
VTRSRLRQSNENQQQEIIIIYCSSFDKQESSDRLSS